MLNYKPSKLHGVEIVGEDSGYLYGLLVEDGKKMSFVGVPDPPSRHVPSGDLFAPEDDVAMRAYREAAEDEMNAFLENAAMPVDQLDTKLNTRELESVLQPKLRTILRETKIANEELGINTLFLTLGMLEWVENDGRICRAPLLFLPVALEQQTNGSVRLAHEGSDIGTNLPLRAKLEELNLRLPEWDDDKGVLGYFSEVESTVRVRTDWTVFREQVCLGFFNYEKYAMYMDLGGETWPDDRKPWNNPDLQAIFGDGYSSPESPITDHSHLDAVRPVVSCHEVFNADSSQTIALIRAAEGLSMVVEGPPGTGKSQTIANIIAEAVAAGKSVLFVSAKRAALEVVKRRLTEADLGPMCLDLHDKLTNRREFYSEIKRTVERAVSLREEKEKVARLTELRDRLNAHSSAMNEPVTPFGCTPFEAMAVLAKLPKELPEDREGRIAFEQLNTLNASNVQATLPLIAALQQRLGATGIPERHPFWNAQIDYLDPARKLDLDQDIDAALAGLATANRAWIQATTALQVEVEASSANARVLRACAERALSAPQHDGVAVRIATWHEDSASIRAVIEALRVRLELHHKHAAAVQPSIWSADLAATEEVFCKLGSRWYRLLSGSFRKSTAGLAALLTSSAPTDPLGKLEIVRDVLRVQRAEAQVALHDALMQRLFGVQWQGLQSDPSVLDRLLTWVLGLRESVTSGEIPSGLLDFFLANHHDENLQDRVVAAESAAQEVVDRYTSVAEQLVFPHVNVAEEKWEDLEQRLKRWQSALDTLPSFIAYGEAKRQAVAKNLGAVIEVADRWPLSSERLTDVFLRSYYSGVVRQAMQSRPELRTFERAGHEAAISEFRTLDDFKLEYNRAQVRLAHQRRLPTFSSQSSGNLLLLKLQCELQRRHKPIRWAMRQAGEAVKRIKPVFMMSPLSVAIHLPPEMDPFDMVVFDEASQIKPEDALCAIARAKQCIVVGDTRQMPPSSMFDRMMDDQDLDEDEGTELGQEARKLESVLSLMSAVVLGQVRRPDLRWHYRSVHPSLIQPSNEMFYSNRLVVFPSPGDTQGQSRIGMIFRYHPETVYEPGSKRRINRREAELVADAVLNHVRTNPDESLLVAAMNKPQADLIYDEVSKRERMDPQPFERYRKAFPHEKLEIKNLETVQGDERDVVFVSVTYGRDASGVIRQQFGPILLDGGERRLNVLFTRARKRCEVFSNMTADDIRAGAPKSGVTTLKQYLQFAKSGLLDITLPTGGEEESPFEEEVSSALRDLGYEVHCQVGCKGFRIDLAVVDSESPGRYVLGIECDGATYHSARSARDRDKLRQRVLEDRGWHLHRIWSHDWWQDREGEVRRLVEAIEATRDVSESEDLLQTELTPGVVLEEQVRAETKLTRQYLQSPAIAYPPDWASLASYMLEVVAAEGPIHRDLLFIRLRDAAGLASARGSTRTRLLSLVEDNLPRIKHFTDALYANDDQLRVPRDWSERPAAEKKIEFVTEAELAAAIRVVVRSSFGIAESDIAPAAMRMLGFRRTTPQAVQRVSSVLAKMIETGGLIRSEGNLEVPR